MFVGYCVFPEDVESMLIRHPAVAQAAVIGIPEQQKGEVVKAFVVLKAGQEVTSSEVMMWAKENMAYYKCPRQVEFKQVCRPPEQVKC